MSKNSISIVILAHPDVKRLNQCIESVKWCDEIIIVVDSTESTQRLASSVQFKGNNIKIFYRSLKDNYSAQRNFGLEKASGDWVLFLDSDEEVSGKLKNEIKRRISSADETISGFYFKRRDFFLGKWLNYGETANVNLLRLARKNKGKWKGRVHEVWDIRGNISILANPILHYPHPTVKDFLSDINRYSDLVAQSWAKEGREVRAWEIVIYPKLKFFQNYILRLGFLDGMPGLIMALMMSFHSFLARSKLWLENKR